MAVAVFVLVLSACGADDEPLAAAVQSAEEAAGDSAAADDDEPADEGEDHSDEDDDDHADEGEDHDDEDDDDHADEGEDHDDEDDDDHADEGEDHDDEDDDEHGDDEHGADDEHGDDEHDDDHDDASGLGAHEHGGAELSVAWLGSDVTVDLVSPTFNVFGFEYEPETDEDVATAADRTEAITATDLVRLNDGANCDLAQPASTEIEREGTHSEITVSWSFVCEDPDEINELDLAQLFAEFPNFEDIDAQWVSESNQSSAELSPAEPTLGFTS